MRPDMAKVIVERPRHGSRARGQGKGYRKKIGRIPWEDQPHRERIKPFNYSKTLNEHLGPLRRYLLSQVGRPWNKVFSEICAHINRRNPVQDHVRDHVADYVALHVRLINGVPYLVAGYWVDRPLSEGYHLLYVCPRTGLLKRVPRKSRKRKPEKRKTPLPLQRDPEHYFCFCQSAWRLVRVLRITQKDLHPGMQPSEGHVFDAVLNKAITRKEALAHYGAAVRAVAVLRPLSKPEVWRFCSQAKSPAVQR
jgi:hypothetical protein